MKEAADKELDKASKRLAEEKARASAPKLSSFWLVRKEERERESEASYMAHCGYSTCVLNSHP